MRARVVGPASMEKRRIRNLRALGTEDIWGLDISLDRREEAEQKFGIATCDPCEAAPAQRPDTMVTSTPPDAYLPYVVEGTKCGPPCLVEATVVQEGLDELITLCRQRPSLVVAPSCTMGYVLGSRNVLALLEQADTGRPMVFAYHSGQFLPDWHPWEDYRAVSYSHGTREVDRTLEAVRHALRVCQQGLEEGFDGLIRGPVMKPVFRKFNCQRGPDPDSRCGWRGGDDPGRRRQRSAHRASCTSGAKGHRTRRAGLHHR